MRAQILACCCIKTEMNIHQKQLALLISAAGLVAKAKKLQGKQQAERGEFRIRIGGGPCSDVKPGSKLFVQTENSDR